MPTPADHTAAVRKALPLVCLTECRDPEAFALLLADTVADPEDAGLVIYGLVELVRFALGMPALAPGPVRRAVLDGMLADLAAHPNPGADAA